MLDAVATSSCRTSCWLAAVSIVMTSLVARAQDTAADWKINKKFTAHPRAGVQQATGRTKGFAYGMVYLAHSY
jgi:hypothetical protein